MRSKRVTTVSIAAGIAVVVLAVTGYLLYAIPESNADRLSRQLAALRSRHSGVSADLAAANRRVTAANHRAQAAEARANQAFAKGHAKGLADAAGSSHSRYDAGYAAGNAAAFGSYGNNWSDGAFNVIHIAAGSNGGHQITERVLLPECLAVYNQNGSVYVQGPAC